ncbi:MAG: DUF2218 domain-containing protein [Chloroflexota bacterium]
MNAKSVITTKNAEKLMRWTIGHFKMKVPAEYDKTQGKVEFPAGICTMQATTDQLIITVEATTSESLSWLKDIVGRHVEKFGIKENIHVEWENASIM